VETPANGHSRLRFGLFEADPSRFAVFGLVDNNHAAAQLLNNAEFVERLLQLLVLCLGLLRMGMSGSASFQSVRKSLSAASARMPAAAAPCEVLACRALARATPRCASAPVQQFQTMPL
jgi:hypothetical protein